MLNETFVRRERLAPGIETTLHNAQGVPLGLTVESFAVPGKLPLYQEAGRDLPQLMNDQAVTGLSLRDRAGAGLLFIPGCASVTDEILRRAARSKILFFDGTFWSDDEMVAAGLGTKTGQRMGHVSVSGVGGSIKSFANVNIAQKIFIHINNTNPILWNDSPQAAFVRAAGWDIAYDGMEITL